MRYKTCIVDQCENKHHARGYCNKHYQQYQRNGDVTDLLEMLYEIINGQCMLGACRKKSFLHGLCFEHFHELVENGYIAVIKEYEACAVKGCYNPLYKDGLCEPHHQDFQYIYDCRDKLVDGIAAKLDHFAEQKVPTEQVDLEDETYKMRTDIEYNQTVDLARSIAAVGLLHPLVLVEKDEGYRIVSGFCRMTAIRLLNRKEYAYETVPAQVVPRGAISEEELLKMAIDENFQRNMISPLETALKSEELRVQRNYSVEKVARLLGTSTKQITRYRNMVKQASKPVLEALHQGRITTKHVYALMRLDKSEQRKWLKKIERNDISANQLHRKLKKEKERDIEKVVDRWLQGQGKVEVHKKGRDRYEFNFAGEGIDFVRQFARFLVKHEEELVE